jgi:NAD(P)-dependent dehydrogenase (short-subunit alcohol dehydrogenase family)
MAGRLAGRVALICGASPNNGGTIAHFMAREGAKVAVNDLVPDVCQQTAKFLQSRGYDAIAVPGDATNEKETPTIVQRVVDQFGFVDILVNMAGRQLRWHVMDINIYDWRRQLDGFLTGGMLTTKYAARNMVEKGKRGSIIHICSDAAHQGEAGNSGYSAAKGGLLNFVRAAAMDLAPYGIRVNSISPTYIEHNIWRFGGVGALATPLRGQFRVTADDFLQGIPLGRFCRSSDLGWAAVFLASDESSFLTAVDLPLDGGAMRKYWPWQPGRFTGQTAYEYAQSAKPQMYGEEVDPSQLPRPAFF